MIRPATLSRRFALLWAGQSASLLGDQITLIALPLLAVEAAGAGPFEVGLLVACLRAPFLLLGLPAGVWATSFGLRRSMICADVLRGGAIGSIPVAAALHVATVGWLVGAALCAGIGTVFFEVCYQSFTPEVVPDERLWHAANTRLSLSGATALMLGPGLGGLLVGAAGAVGSLRVDAGSYLASVATLGAIGRTDAPPRRIERDERPQLRSQIADGWRYVRADPILRAIMWVGCLYNVGASMYDALVVVFAVHYLGLSAAMLGLALACGGAGFPIGSMLSGWAVRRIGLGPALIWAAGPSVAGLLIAAAATGPAELALLGAGTFVVGIGQGCFAVNAITLRQLGSAPSMRARASSVHRFASWGAISVGALAAGTLGALAGLRVAMLAAGLVAGLCFVPLLRSPLRHTRTLAPRTDAAPALVV